MLTRETLKARKLPTETIPMPEWGGSVVVRRLSAKEFIALQKQLKEKPDVAAYLLIVAAVFDESGNRIFTDDDALTFEAENELSVINRLVDAVLKLNPVPDVEQATKNSKTQQPA